MMATPEEPLLTGKQVCAWLGINRRTLYELRRTGGMPMVRVGNALRYRRSAVEAFLAVHTEGGALTLQQVADRLALSLTGVRRLIRNGELPAFRVGRQARVTLESVRRFIADRTVKPLEAPETVRARPLENPSGASETRV